MNQIRLPFLIILLIINLNVFCQSRLDFTHKSNNKKVTFKIGDQIGYVEKGFIFVKSGEIKEIKDSSIILNGKTIKIEDIKFIGHRKKGTTTIVIATALLAGITLGGIPFEDYNSTTNKIVGSSIAISLITIGQIVAYKNRVIKVRNKYGFEVIP